MLLCKLALWPRLGIRGVQHRGYGTSHYSVLGVKPDASAADIKAAYLDKCQKFHPDKNKGHLEKESNSKFVEIQEAYSVIGKPENREIYDMTLTGRPYTSSAKVYEDHHSRPSDWQEVADFRKTVVYRILRNITTFLVILWITTKTLYIIKLRRMQERCRLRDEGKL